ncbi:DNA polymerase III subunit delta [Capnocytophaga felis]|uniref:DNA polymerase III subunit delta n=1 Tax=Capnocytophaga felis TaxID=2267611 RepID=A0A5M4B9I7_9FLAO|nr:DNA polymerase III subunit delta [Capnocytophaga felis]GET45915.1 DNA polymerase III subunit delta [Capnocytophaga felis]GET49233.1 DNA polymerase III subunit delta [Capnocytophaga felis]
MNEVKKIIDSIKKGNIAPIYFLMGEEPYFIDVISDYVENNILSEDEKGFNQMVLYGQDVSVSDIVNNAKRFPMMAPYQVIIVKEAQNLGNSVEDLVSYVENYTPTTILVICYKYKTLDKRKKLVKVLGKSSVLFESKKLYDRDVMNWIPDVLKEKGYTIHPKATQMLVEFLGTDLSRIRNEMEKLTLVVTQNTEITPDVIEKNIGISKEFNNFELRKAIGEKDEAKAVRIVRYFADNPKDNPIVVTLGTLYTFFQQLLTYHGLSDQTDRNVASTLKINPYFVKEYHTAARNYPMKRVSAIIAGLREIDMKSKGVGAVNTPQSDLLKELIINILRS